MNYVSIILLIVGVGGAAFLLCFLLALCRDKSGTIGSAEPHLVITKENKVRGG